MSPVNQSASVDKVNRWLHALKKSYEQQYVLERLIGETQLQIDQLANDERPSMPQSELHYYDPSNDSSMIDILFMSVVLLLMSGFSPLAIVALVGGGISWFLQTIDEHTFLWLVSMAAFLLQMLFTFGFVRTLVICAIILIVKPLAHLYGYVRYKAQLAEKEAAVEERNKRRHDAWERSVAEWEQKMKEEKSRQEMLRKYKSETEQCLKGVRQAIAKLYTANYLDESFRNYSAVATMCGYLDRGRCNTIYGSGGVIATYEEDVQRMAIQGQLESLMRQVNRIEAQNRIMYLELNSLQNEVGLLRGDIDNVALGQLEASEHMQGYLDNVNSSMQALVWSGYYM